MGTESLQPDYVLVAVMGLVNWLATLIVVEGVIFDEPREWLAQRLPLKLSYLLSCHLCAGVWVGFALALVVPGPIEAGVMSVVVNGIAYKAVGHLVLEVVGTLQRVGQ